MKKRMIAIAAATMATMMMATPVLAEDYKIGICNYVDDASLNQIVDNLESRLKETSIFPMTTVMQMPMLWSRLFLISRQTV